MSVKNRGTKAPVVVPKPKIDNTALVEAFRKEGGGVMHFVPGKYRRRGMTVAFIPKGSRVVVATSMAHPNDAFSKKMGTKTAIENFAAGKCIVMPCSHKVHDSIRRSFGSTPFTF
jgi:hypothetical protein